MDIVGYIIGILGILVAIITYSLSKKEKRPVYLIRNIPVIGQKHSLLSEEDKINIFFNDAQVNQVSVCNITLRNVGKATIDSKDIAEGDPLRIVLDEGSTILKAYLVKSTREAINFKITGYQENILNFTFDFLDTYDGALIKVLYDGNISISPAVKGTIKGAPQGFVEQKSGTEEYSKFNTFVSLFLICLGLFGGLFFACKSLAPYLLSGKPLPYPNLKTILVILLILFFAFVFLVGGVTLFNSNYKSKRYKKLFMQ